METIPLAIENSINRSSIAIIRTGARSALITSMELTLIIAIGLVNGRMASGLWLPIRFAITGRKMAKEPAKTCPSPKIGGLATITTMATTTMMATTTTTDIGTIGITSATTITIHTIG